MHLVIDQLKTCKCEEQNVKNWGIVIKLKEIIISTEIKVSCSTLVKL